MTSIETLIQQRCKATADFLNDETLKFISRFSQLIRNTYPTNKVLVCGNGGSAAQALHFSAELVGRYKKAKNQYNAIALCADIAIMTALSNDYNYDDVFSYQIKNLGRKGDLLVALSTSGNSNNILYALEVAAECGMTTVALLGNNGGKAKANSDLSFVSQASDSAIVQEQHLMILHLACELLEP